MPERDLFNLIQYASIDKRLKKELCSPNTRAKAIERARDMPGLEAQLSAEENEFLLGLEVNKLNELAQELINAGFLMKSKEK